SFRNDNKGNQFDLSRESPKCLGLLKIVQGIIQNHIACINHVYRSICSSIVCPIESLTSISQ
ncbi:hypothetical protein, partial [Leuconostoc mesenteroides]|uniref:hypothetical protein n=1 Tax=Leuconostoc mesenteroides TaxID=1245 RepID=UPI00235E537C